MALLLVLVTLALYWPATSHDFVNYDDECNVKDRTTHVTSGLNLGGMLGGHFAVDYAGNWHPVTWLSHMLDCQMFALNPWGHHLTSVLLHALNAGLVFLLLQQMTGRGLAEPGGGGVVRFFTRCASSRWPGCPNARMCSAAASVCSR